MGLNDPNWRRFREVVASDPDDPTICVVRNNGGPETRWAYEGLAIGSTQAMAVKALLPAAPGDCATARSGFNHLTSSGAFQFDHLICYRGIEPITIGGQQRRAAVLVLREEGTSGNMFVGERTIYFDTETRSVIRSALQIVRGNPTNNVDWQARQILSR